MRAFICKYGVYDPEQPRISKLAETLSKAGYDVVWLVCESEPKYDKVVALGRKSKFSYLFAARSYLRKNLQKGDIVLGYVHIGGLAAYLGTKGKENKFIYDYPDPWKGWYFYKTKQDTIVWKLGRQIFKLIECKLYKKADLVITASNAQKEFLYKQHGVRDVFVIFNAPDTKVFNPENKDKTLIKKLKLENKKIVIYIGKICPEYGVDTIIDAVSQVKDKKLVFLILGSGDESYVNVIREKIAKFKLNNVILHGKVPKNQVPHYLNMSGAGVVPFKNYFYNQVGSPNKLFEYMACGIASICSDMHEFRDYIKNEENGFLVEPENSTEFAKRISEVLANPKLIKKFSKINLGKVKKELNWQVQESKFLQAIRSLA
jgi:glycosyltransferase involved in cell wall biosynthesis